MDPQPLQVNGPSASMQGNPMLRVNGVSFFDAPGKVQILERHYHVRTLIGFHTVSTVRFKELLLDLVQEA